MYIRRMRKKTAGRPEAVVPWFIYSFNRAVVSMSDGIAAIPSHSANSIMKFAKIAFGENLRIRFNAATAVPPVASKSS